MDEDAVPAPTLDALVEAPLPTPVSNAPATTAWTVLFVVLGLLLLTALLLLWRRWRKNRYRREGLATLAEIERTDDLAALPVLVKRVALEAWPREDVAALTGDDWLAFLDASYGGHGFKAGPGAHLPDLAYEARHAPDPAERDALLTLVRTWIRSHRGAQR